MTEQEKSKKTKCYEAAAKAGYLAEEAKECENGDMDCPACPWNVEDFFDESMRGG